MLYLYKFYDLLKLSSWSKIGIETSITTLSVHIMSINFILSYRLVSYC